MRKILIAGLLLLTGVTASAQSYCGLRQDNVTNGIGQAIPNVSVTYYSQPSGALATAYSSTTCTAYPGGNPQTTNGLGLTSIYLVPGLYTVTYSGAQIQTQTFVDQNIPVNGATGGGGGISPTLAASPIYSQCANGTSNCPTALAGPGPFQITGTVNNGVVQSPDNCTTISNALASGGRFVLVNGLQGSFGTMACAQSIVMNLSNTDLDLGNVGWSPNQAVAGTDVYSGTGWAVNSNFQSANGSGIYIHNGDIQCTNSGNSGGILLTGNDGGNTGNLFTLDRLSISGCNSGITINSQGLGYIGMVEVQGNAAAMTGPGGTAGPLMLIGNPLGSTGGLSDLQNSIHIMGLGANGANGSDSPTVRVNYTYALQVNGGNSIWIYNNDFDGFGAGVRIGAASLTGQPADIVTGGAGCGHMESIGGPNYFIDTGSTWSPCIITGSASLYLGPSVVVNSGAHAHVDVQNAFSEGSAPPTSVTALPTGGVLAAGTYKIGIQAGNLTPTIQGGETLTTPWYNSAVMGTCTITSGTTNSCAIVYPCVNNTTFYNVIAGTDANPQLDKIVNTTTSGIGPCLPGNATGTYTYTGSETVGATPSIGTVPMITVGSGGSVCVTNANGAWNQDTSSTQVNGYANQVQDANGTYYYPTACDEEEPTSVAVAAGTTTNAINNTGFCKRFLVPPGTANSQDAYLCSVGATNGSGVRTNTWVDMWHPTLPNPFVIANSTANTTVIRGESSAVSGSTVGTIRADVFATSGSQEAFYGTTSIAGGGLLDLYGPSGVTTLRVADGQTNDYTPINILPPGAATNGVNSSGFLWCLQANFWGSAASTSKFCLRNVLSSTTANNPSSTLTGTYVGGATSVGAVDLSGWPNLKLPAITLTAAAPTVVAAQVGLGSTTAAATNCNQGGVLTSVAGCLVVERC